MQDIEGLALIGCSLQELSFLLLVQDDLNLEASCKTKLEEKKKKEEEQILLKITKINIYDIISTIRHRTWTNI